MLFALVIIIFSIIRLIELLLMIILKKAIYPMDLINNTITQSSAFAPATCANVAVGFDILGFAINGIGDTVSLKKRQDLKVIIKKIISKEELPLTSSKNVSSAVILKAIKELNLNIGFDIEIKKGIPLGSGMGGSAASSVAALLALNGFLKKPLKNEKLVEFALYGEFIATGQYHADNVVPCLYGGLTLTRTTDPIEVIPLPVPDNLYSVIVHPDMRIDTKLSRQLLKKNMPVTVFVKQSANLGSFIVSLYEKDFQLMKRAFEDVLIEPYRQILIPGFEKIKKQILSIGAIGMSLSGSGPSLFALTDNIKQAEEIKKEMRRLFKIEGLDSQGWISVVGK